MNKYKYCTLILIFLISIKTSAQNNYFKNRYISPEINIGYTFGATFNIGIGFDFGFYDSNNVNIRYGGSLCYQLIKVNNRFHRQTSFLFMFQNSYFDIKTGISRMRNGWGYQNRNSCIVWGLANDLSINYPNVSNPKLGYKNFIYHKRNWYWFASNYHSLYLGYEYYNK